MGGATMLQLLRNAIADSPRVRLCSSSSGVYHGLLFITPSPSRAYAQFLPSAHRYHLCVCVFCHVYYCSTYDKAVRLFKVSTMCLSLPECVCECVCAFITAVPITKLFAWAGGG
jgi:hypothetical protein